MGVIAQPASSTFEPARRLPWAKAAAKARGPRRAGLVSRAATLPVADDRADGLPAQHGGASIVARTAPELPLLPDTEDPYRARAGLVTAGTGRATRATRFVAPEPLPTTPRAAATSWSSVPDGSAVSSGDACGDVDGVGLGLGLTLGDVDRDGDGTTSRLGEGDGVGTVGGGVPSCPRSRAAPTTVTVPTGLGDQKRQQQREGLRSDRDAADHGPKAIVEGIASSRGTRDDWAGIGSMAAMTRSSKPTLGVVRPMAA